MSEANKPNKKPMNAKTLEAIRQHGLNLLAIFPNATERDPVALCKKLRRVEAAAHRFAEGYCNGVVNPCEDSDIDRETDKLLSRVIKLIGDGSAPVFVNLDPRGYALKIRSEAMRANGWKLHTDWGGYGILAPDLTR